MLDVAEVVKTEANPIAEVAKLQEGPAVEGRAAAQGMQAAEDAETAAKRLQEAERIPAAVEKPKPITEGVPSEPVQERMPVVEERPQQVAEPGPAHEVPAAEIAIENAEINQSSTAILKNGYYEVNGFKISERYYNRLWNEGRPAPTLVAREILSTAKNIKPDIKHGFFRYESLGWEMIYNPVTKEIWHIQPMKGR